MNNDVDFEQFIKILDGALASDDKNVKNALRKFLFVAALALGDDVEPGPFTKMMDTIDALQRRLAALEQKNNTTFTGTSTGTSTGSPVWINSPQYPTHYNSGHTSTAGTWTSPPNSTTTTVTTAGGTFGTTGTYTVQAEPENSGTEIKNSITDKLKKLVKAA